MTADQAKPVVVFDPETDVTFDPAQRSLAENEKTIHAGLGTFLEVGRALLDIRSSGQYREVGFDTFEDYCRGRWGLGKSWAHNQIAAARVYEAIAVHDRGQPPENVEQTKPLAALLNSEGEEAVRRAWAAIVEAHEGDEAITGREVRAYLNPAGSVAPSQRPVSDAYLSTLDKLEATLKTARWAIQKGQEKGVPEPVAERCAEYVAAARALADALEAIANGETPKPLDGEA